MKRTLIIAAAWIGAIASASAQVNDATYYDLIRPNGHPRSASFFQAALDFCYNQTGADRSQNDTPAFKRCMLTQHYRWLYTKAVPTPAAASTASASAPVNDATYYDLIRPNGHPRNASFFQAALDFCYNQTGADRSQNDTPAFKRCMLTQHYRWLYTKGAPAPAAAGSITYNRDSKDPAIGWHWEAGNRVCHQDCENPEIPGSGYTCSNVVWLGASTRKCTRDN